MKNADVLIVFTAKSVNQIIELGGTQSWVLNEKSMRDVEFVVCTRNSDHQYDGECGIRTEQHNSAFLVGRVCGLTKVERLNDRDRFRVDISEYALVSVPDFRHGLSRNPVTYSNVEQCKKDGVDITKLSFQPMLKSEVQNHPSSSKKSGLSISEAKEGLSSFFGVPVETTRTTISS